jgi:sulfite exporter TauE/SafE
MFKVFALIAAGIFMMSLGLYALSASKLPPFPFFNIQFPDVNWGAIGFVAIAGSLASLTSAVVVAKVVK